MLLGSPRPTPAMLCLRAFAPSPSVLPSRPLSHPDRHKHTPLSPLHRTFRAKATVHGVLLTQAADLQVGAGVHAGGAALHVNHVPWAALGCKFAKRSEW